MAEQLGSEAPANGLLRCARCSRYYALEDFVAWYAADFGAHPRECRPCYRRRTGKDVA